MSCISNNLDIDVPALIAHAKAHDMVIGNGYGELKNKTFRIAHMGELTPTHMEELFEVLDEFLN